MLLMRVPDGVPTASALCETNPNNAAPASSSFISAASLGGLLVLCFFIFILLIIVLLPSFSVHLGMSLIGVPYPETCKQIQGGSVMGSGIK